MITIILSGGIGSRFWPLSTKKSPKQFLKIFNGESLFDLTLNRVKNIKNNKILTITNSSYSTILKEYKDVTPIYEPMGRNTFGAFLLTIKYLLDNNLEMEPLVFLPSDHMILDTENFQRDLANSIKIVEEQNIMLVLGVKPTYAETGYGYIKISRIIDKEKYLYGVKGFIEKPKEELAKYYIKLGGYYWNCGIVITTVKAFLNELKLFKPEIHDKLISLSYEQFIKEFATLPNIPVEEAILEKSRAIAMIEARFDWSDLGSWHTYFNFTNKNSPELISLNSNNNNILSTKKTILIDIDDITVIESENGLLIMKNGSDQKLKEALRKKR